MQRIRVETLKTGGAETLDFGLLSAMEAGFNAFGTTIAGIYYPYPFNSLIRTS